MVTACLNGKIGGHEYKMLVDSGSELNIMTLHQAQELELPIDDKFLDFKRHLWSYDGTRRDMLECTSKDWRD